MTLDPRLKLTIPLMQIEKEAQDQINNLLRFDFLKYLAILPDVHCGFFIPIGGVALFDGVISPEGVGYDIGCGMCAIVTDYKFDGVISDRLKIHTEIKSRIPVGLGCCHTHHNNGYPEFKSAIGDKKLDNEVNGKILKQLGTLGHGNHFIEIGKDLDGNLGIVIHSGSRNAGHTVCSYYKNMAKRNDTHLPGHFLDITSDLGRAYFQDMTFMLDYALANRSHMMSVVLDILGLPAKYMKGMINENHNHAVIYNPQTPNLILHRKGATPAEVGQLGIIPGNMKEGSYITEGLGNTEYLKSASHGAGRKMSRGKAKEVLSLEQFEKDMKGICATVNKHLLDEAPRAYKNFNNVIKAQDGILVKLITHISSEINVKGEKASNDRKRKKKQKEF